MDASTFSQLFNFQLSVPSWVVYICVLSGLSNQHSFLTLKVQTMTCIKKDLSELTLYRQRSSILEVKSALPVPLFRLFFSFFVLRVLNCSCYVSVTFGQEYL